MIDGHLADLVPGSQGEIIDPQLSMNLCDPGCCDSPQGEE
jgi:hypothetical protein